MNILKKLFSKEEKKVEVIKDPVEEVINQKIKDIKNIYKKYHYNPKIYFFNNKESDYSSYRIMIEYNYSPFKILLFNNGDIILKLSSNCNFIKNDESIKFLNINKCIDYAFDVLSKGIEENFSEYEAKENLRKINEKIELSRFDRIIE